MDLNLEGKISVVTGGAGGLGKQICVLSDRGVLDTRWGNDSAVSLS